MPGKSVNGKNSKIWYYLIIIIKNRFIKINLLNKYHFLMQIKNIRYVLSTLKKRTKKGVCNMKVKVKKSLLR